MDRDSKQALVFIVVLAAVLGGYLFWTFSGEKANTEKLSKQLAGAIEANDPAAAPGETGEYVKGVRRYFGPVRSAEFLDAETIRIGSGPNATTYIVSELLLRTRKGAAVVEIEIEQGRSPEDGYIDDIQELPPGKVRSDLDADEQVAVERGFSKRGGRVADSSVLDGG